MKESSLYGHVVELLALIERTRKPADEIVAGFFRERRYLGARDRRFISEVLFDVVRNRVLIERVVSVAASADPGAIPGERARPFALLLAYLLAIRALDKEAIERSISVLWSSYVRNVPLDATLERMAEAWRNFPWPSGAAERLALRYSLHRDIVDEWVQNHGEKESEELCGASNAAAPVTARVNTLLMSREECRGKILAEGVECEPTMLSPVGLMFAKRGAIQALTSFKLGAFEMQDEGSQLLAYLLQPRPGEAILDACAGGGGKTLHIAALMQNSGKVVATDRSLKKLENLRARALRAGVRIIDVRKPSPQNIEPHEVFDSVFVDAPCSGTGTYRRNPWLKLMYTPDAMAGLLRTQKELLDTNARCVRPGGKLVYATCSLQKRENEKQIEEFLREHTDFVLVPAKSILNAVGVHVPGISDYLTLFPHVHGTDGYFGAVVQKQRTAGSRQ